MPVLFIFLDLRWRQFKNATGAAFRRSPATFFFLLFLVVVLYGLYGALMVILERWIFGQPFFGPILSTKLVGLLLYLLFSMTAISALAPAIAGLFLSEDLELGLSLPVTVPQWLTWKWVEVFIQSTGSLFLFAAPFLGSYVSHGGILGWSFLLFLPVLSLFLAFPVSMAACAALLLVRWFPPRLLHQLLFVFTVLALSLLIFAFRWLEPERYLSPEGLADLLTVLQGHGMPSRAMLPWVDWTLAILQAMSEGALGGMTARMVSLFFSGFLSFAAYLGLGVLIYPRSWDRAWQRFSSGTRLGALASLPWGRLGLLSRHPHSGRLLLSFFRDPTQWTQSFVLLGLLALYVLSIQKIAQSPMILSPFQLALGNGLFTAFITLSVGSRFLFTSFSIHGRSHWLIRCTPEGWNGFFRSHFLVFGLPSIGFAMVIQGASCMVLDLGGRETIYLIGVTGLDATTLMWLCQAFGILFFNPSQENPLKLMISPGGIFLMLAGLCVISLHLSGRVLAQNHWLWPLLEARGWQVSFLGREWHWFGTLLATEWVLFWGLSRWGQRKFVQAF